MDPESSSSAPISFTISEPERLLGLLTLVLGAGLVALFLLPIYYLGTFEISGPKLLEMVWRKEGSNAMMDDQGYFFMIAVPICSLLLGLTALATSLVGLMRRQAGFALWLAICTLLCLLIAGVGTYYIQHQTAQISLFAKLMPQPSNAYWAAIGLQVPLLLSNGLYVLKR